MTNLVNHFFICMTSIEHEYVIWNFQWLETGTSPFRCDNFTGGKNIILLQAERKRTSRRFSGGGDTQTTSYGLQPNEISLFLAIIFLNLLFFIRVYFMQVNSYGEKTVIRFFLNQWLTGILLVSCWWWLNIVNLLASVSIICSVDILLLFVIECLDGKLGYIEIVLHFIFFKCRRILSCKYATKA